MSETIRLQLLAPERVRRELKSAAAIQGIDMSDLGVLLIQFGLGVLSAGKADPKVLTKSIEDCRAQKNAED